MVDLKSAYDTGSIDKDNRKFLQFKSEGVLYQYRGWPNGLAEAPRKFTKIFKPIFIGTNRLRIK